MGLDNTPSEANGMAPQAAEEAMHILFAIWAWLQAAWAGK